VPARQIRAATTTSIPTYPSSPSSGSPVCSPIRRRCASSSGHGSAASDRWICAAAATRRERVEREEHAVPGPVDLGAVVGPCGFAHELSHPGARRAEALAEDVEQPRRPLDVREEQRDGPGRQSLDRAHVARV
jgi:hypothetical protein